MMAEGFRLSWLKIDEKLYVDLMALEKGSRDWADELEEMGRTTAAATLRGLFDDIWDQFAEHEKTKGGGA